MRQTDIAIVGGGLAGSTAAAMLGRSGFNVVLIEPHPVYPPDFRCEKLDGPQISILEKTGLTRAVLGAATHDGESWVARFGRLVEKRPGDQHGIFYDHLVNTVRSEIAKEVGFIWAKATDIATSADRQVVTLSTGDEISARLVVLANGLNIGMRSRLGMGREILSAGHSVSVGFDLKPLDRLAFEFPALTYYSERPAEQMAYLTLFPIGSTMRANLFVYRDMHDPWLRQLREAPCETLLAAMPGLQKLTGRFDVTGFMKIRPVDLYVTTGHRRAGIVLVGDAFATSCPAAGNGVRKVLTDVERLCNLHIPRWLATAGMGQEKIAAFYDDPVKRACDSSSLAKAYHLRSLSIDPRLPWQVRRWSRYIGRLGIGMLRQVLPRPSIKPIDRHSPAASGGAEVPGIQA